MVNASLARIDGEPEVDLLLAAEEVLVLLLVLVVPELPPELLEPEVPLVVLLVPLVLLVLPLTEVASPGRLTGATFARAWKAARVLFGAALMMR
jgi:hypothetical protein